MKPVSLVDVASYLPQNRVAADYYFADAGSDDALRDSAMFRAPRFRHHVARDETAADMIERACAPLAERLGADALRGVDAVLTNVLLPDMPFTGSGAEVAHRLAARPEWVLDVHNGGCASFVYMLKLARAILQGTGAHSALLCTVQNCAGQVFTQSEIRRRVHAAVPGDGCGVAYLEASSASPIMAVEIRNHGEYAADVGIAGERRYWEPGTEQLDISFNEAKVAKIVARGNHLVPNVVTDVCRQISVAPHEIDALITNQPNRMFLRNWREALALAPERHLDTFDRFGNLFGAAVPVTLDHALTAGTVRDDSLLMLAGFAHAGDLAGAAAIRWRGRGHG